MAEKIKMSEDEKKWRADSDLSTLVEAAKIRKDTARMKAVMTARTERLAALKSVGGKNDGDKDE